MKIEKAIEEYLMWLELEANKSINTVKAYRKDLNSLLEFLIIKQHSLKLKDITVDDLKEYQRHLASRLNKPTSRARRLTAIRSWLRWLYDEGFMAQALADRITLPKLPQRLPKPMSQAELNRLLKSLPEGNLLELRDKALILFLLSTGCRISEALALNRSDLPQGSTKLIVYGKGGKERQVYLTQEARKALDKYLNVRTDTCPALFINYSRSIHNDSARRLTQAGARYIVKRIRRQLGVWSFTSPHVARHTAATELLSATGGDVRLVQEVLGHASITTLQGYTQIVDVRKRKAYELYEKHLENLQD